MSNLNSVFLHSFSKFLFICIFAMQLGGCASDSGYGSRTIPKPMDTPAQEEPSSITGQELSALEDEEEKSSTAKGGVKVAILLPLSGTNAKLGESMLRAAEMAVFEIGHSEFQLVPKDTQGTAAGAAAAARSALNEGARLVLGPVFAEEVRAVKPITQGKGINMVAFSTDWTLADRSTFLIGFLPFDQVNRVLSYASQNGLNRVGVLSPSDNYGNAVTSAVDTYAQGQQVSIVRMERLPVLNNQIAAKVRSFSDYDQRQQTNNEHGAPFDAVLLPMGGNMVRQVSGLMTSAELPPSTVKRLGTGLMDDAGLANDANLDGAWFAAPSPSARRAFEKRYGDVYGIKPLRLASLAYDATALAAILARSSFDETGAPSYDYNALTNPNGFSGVDGIFRFRPDGISERGLAVLEFQNGSIKVVDEAPETFQRDAF